MTRNTKLLDTKVELSNDKIHVFLLQLDVINSDNFIDFLSEDEIARADKLKVEDKRNQFIITRGVLRKLLSNCLGKSTDQISFLYGKHNKPYIDDHYHNNSVEFNVSHSGNYALIALTLDSKVGVDIEKINQNIDYLPLSKRFFSEKEYKELSSIDETKQLHSFYRTWARKESFIKATGEGISSGLDKFSVSLNDIETSSIDIVRTDFENEKWYCHDLMSVENYKSSLASCHETIDIVFHQ